MLFNSFISIAQLSYAYMRNYSIKDGLSQNTVRSIFMDNNNLLWVGTRSGLNYFNSDKFVQIKSDKYPSFNFADIRYINADAAGNILAIGDNKFYIYNFVSNELRRLEGNYITLSVLEDKRVFSTSDKGLCLYSDTACTILDVAFSNSRILSNFDDNLVIEKDYKLYIYNVSKSTSYLIHKFQESDLLSCCSYQGKLWINSKMSGMYIFIPSNKAFYKWDDHILDSMIMHQGNLIIGSQGKLYISTNYYGLLCYDISRKEIISKLTHTIGSPYTLRHNNLNAIYIDKNNAFWIGSYAGGLDYVNPHYRYFSYINTVKNMPNAINTAGSIVELPDYLFVGSEGGIIRINKNNYEAEYEIISTRYMPNSGVKYLAKHNEHSFWLAPYMRGLHIYDTECKTIVKSYSTNGFDNIRQVYQDSKGTTWILSLEKGLGVVDDKTLSIRHVPEFESLVCGKHIYLTSVYEAGNGDLFFSASNSGIFLKKSVNDKWVNLRTDNTDFLPTNDIRHIYVDENDWWISTYGYGVIKYNQVTKEARCYSEAVGLIDNRIIHSLKDKSGNIWVVTLSGLSRISKDNIITNFHNNECLVEEPTQNGISCLENGEIWISINGGIIFFNPEKWEEKLYVPRLEFVNVDINGNDDTESIINRAIRDKSCRNFDLTLDYNNFPVNISFNSIDYISAYNKSFRYRIRGISDSWSYLSTLNRISLAQLEPGKYTLEISTMDSKGNWVPETLRLGLKVMPPIWLSWWAILSYFIIVAAIIIWYIRHIKYEKDLQNQVWKSEVILNNTLKMNEEKIRLYTNFSHELKTPLTLISAPIKLLLEEVSDKRILRYIKIIDSNCTKIMFLINQLMDFRKMENGKLELKLKGCNVGSIMNSVYSSFNDYCKRKRIELHVTIDKSVDARLVFDPFLIETMMFNLLSNAIKYTPKDGIVSISCKKICIEDIPDEYSEELKSETGEYLSFSVSDTGIGIPKEALTHIFERFYQVNGSIGGTGIGLNLCQNIAKLHNGCIYALNNVEGGATFTFVIPYIIFDGSADEVKPYDKENEKAAAPVMEEIIKPDANNASHDVIEKPRILVVDDNYDIFDFIYNELCDEFSIEHAVDGVEAIDFVKEKDYSLIITDIMMPRMDGLELCKRLKNSIDTSHIPVIILTANPSESNKLKGYELHADDFLPKPFTVEILKACVRNVLWQYQKRKEQFSNQAIDRDKTEPMTIDDKFMTMLYQYIDDDISNSELSLDDICSKLAMGKTSFYRKIKALTLDTPAKIIYKRRLGMAKKLLDEGNTYISDIAYKVGFTDPIYFSRCFKKEFGMSPRDYIKNLEK